MSVVLSSEEDSYFFPSSMRRSQSQTKLADAASAYNAAPDFTDPYRPECKTFSDSDHSSVPSSPRTTHIETTDAPFSPPPPGPFSIVSEFDEALNIDESSDDHFGIGSFTVEKLYMHPEIRADDNLDLLSSPRTGDSYTDSPADQEESSSTSRPDSPDHGEKAEDDTAVVSKPSRQVDYLSHEWREEDIWSSWRYVISKRGEFSNSARLENASWRTWMKAKYHLGTVSPETLNWLKDCDVTWLYGPLQSRGSPLYSNRTETTSESLSKSDSLMNLSTKPILKKRSMSEVMLQRSLSSASLLKQATAAVHAQESRKVRRPCIERASTDSVAVCLSPGRGSRESRSWAVSTDSSSTMSPSERRHIHFNEQVAQCIAVDVKGDEEEEEEEDDFTLDPYGEDSGSDEGVMMKRVKPKRRPLTRKRAKKASLIEGKIIAMLPSTTLKYQEDREYHESAMKHSTGVSPSDHLSPSSSQETLCPPKRVTRFFFEDEDEDEDLEEGRRGDGGTAGSSTMGWRPAANGAGSLHRSTSAGSFLGEPVGMRRTPSGMFMPFDQPDVTVGEGLFGRVIDTVNTARDIAHVIWNVGWRK